MEPIQKPFSFTGTAGGYFIVTIVTAITAYIIIFGWPLGFNFAASWIADNATVNGRKLRYSAGYGETLKFLLVNTLLVLVTFGIYAFWFAPKSYRYIMEHTSFVDGGLPQPTSVPAQALPINPVS